MGSETTLDPAQFSAKPLTVSGKGVPADFPRLLELLANPDGELHFEVTGLLDRKRRRVVSCTIEGFVFLTCQATMEVFRHPVKVKDRLVLVDDESQLPPFQEEPEEEDHVVAEGPLEVRELVEEAVILALPMVPRKPGLEAAGSRSGAAAKPEKKSPFEALAALKNPK